MLIEILKTVAYTFFFAFGLTACFAFLAYCHSEKRFNEVKEPGLDLTEDFYEREIV